jgi:hypothetical protein
MTPTTTAVARGDTVEMLALAEAAALPVLEEILTAQPGVAITANANMGSNPRTASRLARTVALG